MEQNKTQHINSWTELLDTFFQSDVGLSLRKQIAESTASVFPPESQRLTAFHFSQSVERRWVIVGEWFST